MRAEIQGYSGASWILFNDTFSFSNLEDQQLHNRHWLSLYKLNKMEGSKRELQDVEAEVNKNKNSLSGVIRYISVMAMEGNRIRWSRGLRTNSLDCKIEEWLVCQRFHIPSENITNARKKKHVRNGWCIWLLSRSKGDQDRKRELKLVMSLWDFMKSELYVEAVNRTDCFRLTILHSVRMLTRVFNYDVSVRRISLLLPLFHRLPP